VDDYTPQYGDNILAQISAVARQIVEAKTAVQEAEEALKARQRELEHLQQTVLPELMNDAGQEQVTTLEGLRVTLKQVYRGTPSKENERDAFRWLRDNGHGGIIKSQVQADLGKVDEEKALEAVNSLRQLGFQAGAKQSVAWQTLGSLVKELLATGEAVPLDVLGVRVWTEAEVKPK
jgi:hypothetical protein